MLAIHGPVDIPCLDRIPTKGGSWQSETRSYKMGPCPAATSEALATSAVHIAAAASDDLEAISHEAADDATAQFGTVVASSTRAGHRDGLAYAYDAHSLTKADLQVMMGSTVQGVVTTEDAPAQVEVPKKLFADTVIGKVTAKEEEVKAVVEQTADAKDVPKKVAGVPEHKSQEEALDDKIIKGQKISVAFPKTKSALDRIDDPEDLATAKPNSVGCDPNVGCPSSGEVPHLVVTSAFKACGYTCEKDSIKHIPLDHKICMANPAAHECKQCLACALPKMSKATGVTYEITREGKVGGKASVVAKPLQEGATINDAHLSATGHYYIGAGRRRVGSGFGRRRAPALTTTEKRVHEAAQANPLVKTGDAKVVVKHVKVVVSAEHPDGIATTVHVVPVTPKGHAAAKKAKATKPLPVVNLAPKPVPAGLAKGEALGKTVTVQGVKTQEIVSAKTGVAITPKVIAPASATSVAKETAAEKRTDAATAWAKKVEAKEAEKAKEDQKEAGVFALP